MKAPNFQLNFTKLRVGTPGSLVVKLSFQLSFTTKLPEYTIKMGEP